MTNIRSAILLAALLLPATFPVQATPMPALAVQKVQSLDVVQVRNHGHRHDRHDRHKRDHRFHGRDDYYDRNDQSGVLFKSFVTGTLFR